MSNYLYVNNAESSLLNAVGPTDVSITLPGGQGARFPSPIAPQTFLLTIEDTSGNIEIVECTARATDVLTVVRGREGTLARAWSASTGVYMRVTAGMLNQVDWTKFAGQPSGVATLDSTNKIPIAQFDTPLQTFCDARYNLALGFTPVQQGGGTGQATNKIFIGWASTSKLKAQVDATDLGNIALESWVTGTATALAATKLSTVRNIAISGVVSGSANFDGSANINIGTSMAANAISISNVNGLQAQLNTFAVNNATNNANITWTGTVTAGAIVDNSDIRIKEDIAPMSVEDAWRIIEKTKIVRFYNTLTKKQEFGVIADDQQSVTPEVISIGADPDRLLGVGYGRLSMPMFVVLQDLRKRGVI
jgi:hypothetical protein